MNALPTPALDVVIERDGYYAATHTLFLAALEDGFTPVAAEAVAAELEAEIEAEFAAQHASEIAAENAWLVAAENAGWEEAEAERRHYGF